MFKLLSYACCAAILYFIGNAIHDRYAYVSDRRDWLEEAKRMSCTPEDNSRLLAQLQSEVLDSIQQRAAANELTQRLSDIKFEISAFEKQRLSGEPVGMPICTNDHFPWKPGKGALDDGACSMPAYLRCTARVVVKVPGDIVKEADMAARYVTLSPYGGAETVSAGGESYALIKIEAELSKVVPRFSRSNLYIEDRRNGKAAREFEYSLADVSGLIENWLQFHEKREKIMRDHQVANDIGGAITGGGYGGSVNKLRDEQIELKAPPAGQ